jgi:RNA polymerase sigma factor (sigma-70 family)
METLPCPRMDATKDAAAELAVGDGYLLERFIRERDEPAFAELVRRHGPMVLGVCRRVLDNPHDAEDCFQAVFMVLVRKAETIRPSSMVGNWLYGVAYRTALEARKLAARRRIIEKKKHELAHAELAPGESPAAQWQEMRPALDRELSRLPERYRCILVACDLEGKTRRTVAEEFDLAEGTVASRLARARRLLAKRMSRYASISAGALGMLLSAEAAVPVPPSLIDTTARSAIQLAGSNSGPGTLSPYVAALCDAVVSKMVWTKIQNATAASVAVLTAIAFVVITLIPAVQPGVGALPKPDKVKPSQYLRDFIVAKVDTQKQRIQICQAPAAAGDGVPKTYELVIEPGAKITIDGKESRLADLREGLEVQLEIDANPAGSCRARCINAEGPRVDGVVKEIDEKKQMLKVNTDDKHLVAEAIVAPDAEVVVAGAKSKLVDVKPGMRVTLQMSAATEPRYIVAIKAKPMK